VFFDRIVAVEQIAASQDTARLTSLSPSTVTGSGPIGHRRDDVSSAWTTPILEDELVDLLAIGRRTRPMDGDAELKEDTDLLSADELLGHMVGDSSNFS
jgi:hypothetical protein